jgi:putative transposase
MIIKRSTKHILKYQNKSKTKKLDLLFDLYKKELENQLYHIYMDHIPLQKNLSSKELEGKYIFHSQWLQVIYKQASEIVRSLSKKKDYRFPNIKNISINIDERLFDIVKTNKEFNGFIRIKLPFFQENKKRAETINLPYKEYKHSLSYTDWNKRKTIQLKKEKDNYFVNFIYEKNINKKENGKDLAIDIGYKKLITTSEKNFIGKELELIYNKISNKKQGSKNFKDLLIQRNNLINYFCNSLDYKDLKNLIIEDLFLVKHKSKIHHKVMNKLQRWSYRKVLTKLERLSEIEGFNLIKVDPAYTSQTCSNCGFVDKDSRKFEKFLCTKCGFEEDADYNAALNILHRGVYNPSTLKT